MTTEQQTAVTLLHELRKREVQAIGAAISTQSWHGVEVAYNQLRDKMDAAGAWHEPRLASQADQGWRTIDSAPKDGTAILGLITGSDLPHTIRFVRQKWLIAWDAYDLSAECDAPTHWMPLLATHPQPSQKDVEVTGVDIWDGPADGPHEQRLRDQRGFTQPSQKGEGDE